MGVGVGNLRQRVGTIDDRDERARLGELSNEAQVFAARGTDSCEDFAAAS